MRNLKGRLGLIFMGVVLIIGLVVGYSIWNSLKDTKKELAEQRAKAAELAKRDSLTRAYKDSVDRIIVELQLEERQLKQERYELQQRLVLLQAKYIEKIGQIDTLWQAGSVISELEAAFPNWKGQFWEAFRHDGVHGLIAPRFFGAEVVEIKTELDKSQQEIGLKDSTILNLENNLTLKDSLFLLSELKADSIWRNYQNAYAEYDSLNRKYQTLLLKKWFTLKLSPTNLISAGLGFGAGYATRKAMD